MKREIIYWFFVNHWKGGALVTTDMAATDFLQVIKLADDWEGIKLENIKTIYKGDQVL